MHLKTFEQSIEPKILSRGIDYYENKHIEEVEQVEKGEFVATISGYDDYNVTVKIDSNLNVVSTSCDCPYDWGPTCKHEVALLYHIRENKLYEQSIGDGPLSKIKQDLQQLTKAELLEILVDLSKKSKLVKEYLNWELGYESEDY